MPPHPLQTLSTLLGHAPVGLVQPVVRASTLLVGQSMCATDEGLAQHPAVGRPMAVVCGDTDRTTLLERYHLEVGGVLGPAIEPDSHKAPQGLAALDGPHPFAWAMPEPDASMIACWLVLDGYALALVMAQVRRVPSEVRDEVEQALLALRRTLARSLESITSKLSGTGLIVIDGETVRASDRRGGAWVEAREAGPLVRGVEGGALVGGAPMEGVEHLEVVTVRPVRPAREPVGLVLTPAQREVARLLSSSATLGEIAEARGTRESTIRRHRDDIYKALGTARRVEIMRQLTEA